MNWLAEHLHRNPQAGPFELPPRYAGAVIERLPNQNIRDVVHDYLQHFGEHAAAGRAPLFLGQSGVGKSMGAAVIASRVHTRVPLDTRWVSVPHLALDANLFAFDPEPYYTVPFMVLDDLHALLPAIKRPFAALTAILSARFDSLRPTLITGNLELPEHQEWETLARLYSPAIARRLQEGSEGLRVII